MAKEKPANKGKGRKHESKSPKDFYEIHGSELKRNRKSCPRCGEGTWLGKHKNRQYCGRCGYTLFDSKNVIAQTDTEKTENTKKTGEENKDSKQEPEHGSEHEHKSEHAEHEQGKKPEH